MNFLDPDLFYSFRQPILSKICKVKPWESDNLPIRREAFNGAITLNFCLRRDIAKIITHIKTCRFNGFGSLTPPNLAWSVGLAGGSYISNSVSTTVLQRDGAAI